MDGLGSASSPLFLFAGKEKEAKRKAAKAIKIWVPYLGLQALAYALQGLSPQRGGWGVTPGAPRRGHAVRDKKILGLRRFFNKLSIAFLEEM